MVAIIAVPVMSREQLTNEVTQLKALNKELMEGYLLLQQSNVELNEKLLRLDSAYFIIKDGMATFQDSVFFKMISVERLRVGTLQPLHGDTLRVTP